jgi:hypothetical protein
LSYPINPDSSFYHFGDDECLEAHKRSNSDNYLQLGNIISTNSNQVSNSVLQKIIDDLKENTPYAFLPIKVFSEILPLDPVFFHS